MNPKPNPAHSPEFSETTELSETAETSNTLSIDEFFRQLEAKEKDLDISAEMVIEIEESTVEDQDLSDFLQMDVSVAPNKPETRLAAFEDNSSQSIHNSVPSIHSSVQPANNPILQAEIRSLQNQVARMEAERLELYETARRRQSDFDNYKKRTERERSETFRNQLSNLATQMLPVVDNLNRAMDLSDVVSEAKSKDFQQFIEGIVLVSQQLNEILAEMGVQPILVVGEPFDPHYHEAVATEVTAEYPPQTVMAELLRGYRIDDKVIRPSMVKVSISTNTGSLPSLTSVS